MKLIEAAKWYVERGMSVIPVKEKLPTIKWKDFQEKLATEAELEEWFGKSEGLGIITGKCSNLTVVDADSEEAVKEIEALISDIDVPTVVTPGGGKHYYFLYLANTRNVQGIRDKIDIRSEGGYVVAPPTERNGAGSYAWEAGKSFATIKLRHLPKALVQYLYRHNSNTLIGRVPLGDSPKGLKSSNIKDSTVGEKVYQDAHQDGIESVSGVSGCSMPEEGVSKRNNVYQGVSKIPVGRRDAAIFHAANSMVKGGMNEELARDLLRYLGTQMCEEPFPDNEIEIKIQSALERDVRFKRAWKDEIEDYLESCPGEFSQVALYHDLDATTRNEKSIIRNTLARMSEQDDPVIMKMPKSGWFKTLEGAPEANDWMASKTNTYDIRLPFGLNDYVDVYPGDVILIAGSPGAGKTATVLDTARNNHERHQINYWSTEVSPVSLKVKLLKDDTDIDNLNLKHYDYSNPSQLDPTGFNIVDYIEAFESPHMIAQELKSIHRRIAPGGICIACIQKDPSKAYGWGGFITKAKPVLVLGLDPKRDLGRVTVMKATNTPMIDITDYVGYYKLNNPARIEMVEPLVKREEQKVL